MQNALKHTISPKIQQFVALEAKNIKKYATSIELARLTLKGIDPVFGFTSVYSELTGDIHSNRAKQLIKLCSPVKINHDFAHIEVLENGKAFTRGRIGANWNLTALEWFLLQTHFCKNSVRGPLLDFLTGNAINVQVH